MPKRENGWIVRALRVVPVSPPPMIKLHHVLDIPTVWRTYSPRRSHVQAHKGEQQAFV